MTSKREEWRWTTDGRYGTNGVDEILILPLTEQGQATREIYERLKRPIKKRGERNWKK